MKIQANSWKEMRKKLESMQYETEEMVVSGMCAMDFIDNMIDDLPYPAELKIEDLSGNMIIMKVKDGKN